MKRTSPRACDQGPRACQLLERVVTIYEKSVNDAARVLPFTDSKFLARHRIGYCIGTSLLETLPSDGGFVTELQDLGVITANRTEYFEGAVVVPILSLEGTVTSLAGIRGDTVLTLPGRDIVWNLPAARSYVELSVTSDLLSALRADCGDSHNVIAALGTELPEAALSAENVTLSMSRDLADSLQVRGLNVRFDDEAPRFDTETLASGTGFAVTFGSRRYEVRGLERTPRSIKATVRIERCGKLHVDTVDLYAARARRTLALDIARVFEQDASTINADITKLILACETFNPAVETSLVTESEMTDAERAAARAFGSSPELFDTIQRHFDDVGVVGEHANRLVSYAAAISRKAAKPLSVVVLSSSGAGKSALQDAVLRLCPPEDVIKLTSLSGKALFYKAKDSLKHKILAVEEGEGADKAAYAIRNLISAGELVIESTTKDEAGQLTTRSNRVEGPVSVFLTTTRPDMDPETKSRFIVLSVDESPEQTRRILKSQRHSQTLEALRSDANAEAIVTLHHNFQRLLSPVSVVNPHAEELFYGDDRLQSRRDQPKYLALINAVAFMRQMQKETKHYGGVNYVEVDETDIAIANHLSREVLGQSIDELSGPARELLLIIEALFTKTESETVTRRDIRTFSGWANTRVHRYIQELVELEYVLVDSGRNGCRYRYRLGVARTGPVAPVS